MVRLRREIEGVRRNWAVPVPGYARDAQTTAWVLPQLDRWLIQQAPGRTLLAGSVRRDLAEALARAGHFVTVADLDDDEIADWHAQLPAALAAQLTLVAKPYGEMAFGPASFDRIALFDALARYRQPQWVVAKAARELKPDATLAVREPVRQPLGELARFAEPTGVTHRMLGPALTVLDAVLHGRHNRLLLNRQAREAIDRGAHLQQQRFAAVGSDVPAYLTAHLTLDTGWLGHPLRLQFADVAFGARLPLRRVLAQAVAHVPESAPAEERGVRAVGLLARRALAGRDLFG